MRSDSGIPVHIAFIMDGNGRWAKKRLLPRKLGHREGVKTIDRIADCVFERGIKYLTLFAFSTENWKRPADEVSGLLSLFATYLRRKIPKMVKNGIVLRVIGSARGLDEKLHKLIADAYERTKYGTRGNLTVCFDYGGRADIVAAVNKCVEEGRTVDEETFGGMLQTADLPDPDIIVRTGGEKRISNFLLYQMAYSELYFSDTLWPEFSEKELDDILAAYARTDRRFGGIDEEGQV